MGFRLGELGEEWAGVFRSTGHGLGVGKGEQWLGLGARRDLPMHGVTLRRYRRRSRRTSVVLGALQSW